MSNFNPTTGANESATGYEPLFKYLDPDDIPRLTEHLRKFIAYVSDFQEHTLTEIASQLGMSACSASARWRDVKKLGGLYTKRKDAHTPGLWWYRLTKKP